MSLTDDLIGLYRVDSQLRGLRTRVDSAKELLEIRERKLGEVQAGHDETVARQRQSQAHIANLEGESADFEQRIEKLRSELNSSTTDKQYQAILAEMNSLQELRDEVETTNLTAIIVTTVLPLAIMPLAIPIWARILEQTHVIVFRSIHSWTFVTASLLYLIAVEMELISLMFIAAGTLGVGFAGGMLAWNLGHQSFAPPHQDSQYMSVHVFLTGIRGLIAPFAGVLIYTAFAAGGHPGLTFAVSLGLNIIGAIGFLLLRRNLARHHQPPEVGAS